MAARALLLVGLLFGGAASAAPLSVVVISDLNSSYGSVTYEPRVADAIRAIVAIKPDLVISTGDMVAGQRRPHLSEAEVRAISPMVEQLIREVSRNYRGHDGVATYLAEAKQHILENHRRFLPDEEGEESEGEEASATRRHRLFQVNVVVDRSEERGAPVVSERLPTQERSAAGPPLPSPPPPRSDPRAT